MPFLCENKKVIRIAVMKDSLTENYNTNYYTGWLEEKTGYDIEFVYFTRGYEKEYLSAMLRMKIGSVDAVFLSDSNEIISKDEFEGFVDKTKDPNQNGIEDELALITNSSMSAFRSEELLKMAYYGNEELGKEYFERYRMEGLLSEVCTDFTTKQLQEIVNSPSDYVGAFTAQSITDILYPFCPEIIERYTFVGPLRDVNGQTHANCVSCDMGIGGYIPQNAVHKEEAFEIMDLMLSGEASVIATYGELNVDYREATEGDLS